MKKKIDNKKLNNMDKLIKKFERMIKSKRTIYNQEFLKVDKFYNKKGPIKDNTTLTYIIIELHKNNYDIKRKYYKLFFEQIL